MFCHNSSFVNLSSCTPDASKPRLATSCSNPNGVVMAVQDKSMKFNKLSVLEHDGDKWSWMGGERFVNYAGTSTAVKVQESSKWQLFDVQSRNDEVCVAFLEESLWPRVYCHRGSTWVELGKSKNEHRIGKTSPHGDIELLMPGCDCPEYDNTYFVITGRSDDTNESTVWYYVDSGDEDGEWKRLGASVTTDIKPSGDAHLAVSNVGTSSCHLHALVGDVDTKTLQLARFSTKEPSRFHSGVWEVVASVRPTEGDLVAGRSDLAFANGVPTVAWSAKVDNHDFAYVSSWKDYPSSDASARDGLVVAGGAIPSPLGIQDLSIDSYGNMVYVEVTSAGSGSDKIQVNAMDVADANDGDEWLSYSPKKTRADNVDELLPHPKPHDRSNRLCQNESQDGSSGLWNVANHGGAAAAAHSHVKVACNGDVLLAHVAAVEGTPVAMLAKNGPIDETNICAGGRRLGGGFFGGLFGR